MQLERVLIAMAVMDLRVPPAEIHITSTHI
jgi:hypothetical protein